MKDIESQIEFCKDFSDHIWIEGYYGYECEKCGQFYSYGNAPWNIPENDEDNEDIEDHLIHDDINEDRRNGAIDQH
jgi:hypothetical protein